MAENAISGNFMFESPLLSSGRHVALTDNNVDDGDNVTIRNVPAFWARSGD
jgi:hypothetical protein